MTLREVEFIPPDDVPVGTEIPTKRGWFFSQHACDDGLYIYIEDENGCIQLVDYKNIKFLHSPICGGCKQKDKNNKLREVKYRFPMKDSPVQIGWFHRWMSKGFGALIEAKDGSLVFIESVGIDRFTSPPVEDTPYPHSKIVDP